MQAMNIVEGFYFKLYDDSIFYAKGVSHPKDRVVAFPKYIRSVDGDRTTPNGVKYTKVGDIINEYRIAMTKYSNYVVYDDYFGRKVVLVPLRDIVEVYSPIDKAVKIINSDPTKGILADVKDMLNDILNSTSARTIGVSGSILVDLYREDSDIDIVVLDENDGRKVYSFLSEVIDKPYSKIRRYSEESVARLYLTRVAETPIGFREFVAQERRRILEGLYGDREYFIRLIDRSHTDDIYDVYRCRKLGFSTMMLRVLDAKRSIYTPCRYGVEVLKVLEGVAVDVEEVYSLRGRFNEIAAEGETVVARGSIELLEYRNGGRKYRLYLGDPGDYMYLAEWVR
ncbi:MAG: hypothetical protein N3D82_01335 [Ignisphaera sp.]|nr:hypothetical protein [Ignisphaera sp.]MCX8167660.1 hypothetical protein [Ignisphaera sp.]MDW8085650.1 hypothetical protein [Ignisphaera sp.]